MLNLSEARVMTSEIDLQPQASKAGSSRPRTAIWRLLALLSGVCILVAICVLVSMEPRRRAVARLYELGARVGTMPVYVPDRGPIVAWKQRLLADSSMGRRVRYLAAVEEISFYGDDIYDRDLALLSNFPELRILYLEHTSISDDGLCLLSGLSDLRSLCLEWTAITDAGLKHLQRLPRLRRLNLCFTKITGRGFSGFKSADALEELDLSYCENLTDEGLLELRNFKNLRILNLDVCDNLEGPGYAVFSELKNLQELRLFYVPDPSLKKHFAHVPKVVIDGE